MIKKFGKYLVTLIIFLELVFSLVGFHSLFIFAFSDNCSIYDLSTISSDESIEFVIEHNIEIPNKIKNSVNLGKITRDIIQKVANNPNYIFAYNYTEMYNYAENIKNCVNECKKSKNISININRSNYILQYNTVQDINGNWVTSGGDYDVKWDKYNCYAYALNRVEDPKFYSNDSFIQYQPGDMSQSGTFEECESIIDLVEIVKSDLSSMGYLNIYSQMEMPTINTNQALICVRMCEEDYHFMKYDIFTNSWYHKPGTSAILKYNYFPNNSDYWYQESSKFGVEELGNVIYDSEIYYIVYDKNRISIEENITEYSYEFDINAGKDVIIEINNSFNNYSCLINIYSNFSKNVKIYNSNMELMNSYQGNNISFYNTLLPNTYYIAISYNDIINYENTYLTISKHDHYFDYSFTNTGHIGTCSVCNYSENDSHNFDRNYQWLNYSLHTVDCICTYEINQGHAITKSTYNSSSRFARCILCGGMAEKGFIGILMRDENNQYLFSNGSFILPNGVIVLDERDVCDFLNEKII